MTERFLFDRCRDWYAIWRGAHKDSMPPHWDDLEPWVREAILRVANGIDSENVTCANTVNPNTSPNMDFSTPTNSTT